MHGQTCAGLAQMDAIGGMDDDDEEDADFEEGGGSDEDDGDDDDSELSGMSDIDDEVSRAWLATFPFPQYSRPRAAPGWEPKQRGGLRPVAPQAPRVLLTGMDCFCT